MSVLRYMVDQRRGASGKEAWRESLRHTYREDGKVKNETVSNISRLPDELIELVRGYLRGPSASWMLRAGW